MMNGARSLLRPGRLMARGRVVAAQMLRQDCTVDRRRTASSRPFMSSASFTPPQGLVDRLLRADAADMRSSKDDDDAWVDKPSAHVEDPLHPNGFDFTVDLDVAPATDTGVARFARDWVRTGAAPDPFALVEGEITSLSAGIQKLLGSDHPVLELCARYFFEAGRDGGKKVRPTMVLLMAIATNKHRKIGDGAEVSSSDSQELDECRSLSSQRRLAEITEMIHTASLFHDDVIDKADARRGAPSANRAYGDKLAILAGDFLLARASIALARLRDCEVVELMSTVIEHLVKGEVMQMRGGHLKDCTALEYYFHKNYYKTGSLMANSCRSAAVLGRHTEEVEDIAFAYGKHIGLAFQLVDDVLDFEGSMQTLGKPALADLKAGLATAPVILAADQFPRLQILIDRKFTEPGDVDEALELVNRSAGLQRAKDLAVAQADLATDAIMRLGPSPARDALAHLAYKVVARKH
jgi:solanesyl diphosphate synthase